MGIDKLRLYRTTEGFTLGLLRGIKGSRAGRDNPDWGVATAALAVDQLELAEDSNVVSIWTFLCEQALKVETWDPFEERIGKGVACIMQHLRQIRPSLDDEISTILQRIDRCAALNLMNNNIDPEQTKKAYAGLFRLAQREDSAQKLLEKRACSGFSLFAFGHTVKPGDNVANAMFLLPFFDKIPRNQGELADEMKPAANTDEMGRAFKYIEEAWNPKGIEGNAHKLQKDAANVSVDFGLVAHIMEIMRRAAPSIVTQKGTLNNRGRFLSSVLDRVVTERDPLVHFTVELLVTEPSFVQFCLDIEPWKTLIHKHVDSHTGLLGALADWWETQDGMSVTSAQLRLANLALVEAVKATDDLVRADLNRLERAVEGKLGKINSQQWAEFLDWLSSEFQHYEASGLLRLSRRVSVFRSLLGAFSRPDSQRKEAVEKLLDDPLMAFTEEDKERIRAGNA